MPLFAAKPERVLHQTSEHQPSQDHAGLHTRLLEFGLREKEIAQILQDHDAAYINANLDIVAGMLFKGAIKTTLRAATLDALNQDYRPHKTPYESRQDALQQAQVSARQQQLAEAEKAEQQEWLKAEFEKQRLDLALHSLSEAERQGLEADFLSEIVQSAQPNYAILRPIYKKSGLDHAMIQGCFRHFARQRLLPVATDEEFAQFLKERGNC